MTAPTQPTPWTAPTPLPASYSTARLTLRYWQQSDAPALFEAISTDRQTLVPWMPWALTEHRAIHETVFSIEKMRRDREVPNIDSYAMGIVDRTSNAIVGGTGLHRIRAAEHEAEVGYWIRAPLRNRGLCTEIVGGLITWAFTPQTAGGWGIRRIHIRCAGSNVPSARVPEKLGLTCEARHVKERWVAGQGWEDTLVWGVLAEEWDLGRGAKR